MTDLNTEKEINAQIEVLSDLRDKALNENNDYSDFDTEIIITMSSLLKKIMLSEDNKTSEDAYSTIKRVLEATPFIDSGVVLSLIYLDQGKGLTQDDLDKESGEMYSLEVYHDALDLVSSYLTDEGLKSFNFNDEMLLAVTSRFPFMPLVTYFISRKEVDVFDLKNGLQAHQVDTPFSRSVERIATEMSSGVSLDNKEGEQDKTSVFIV